MLEVCVTGLFFAIYRVRWATRHPQHSNCGIDYAEPVFAGLFWPVYLLAMILKGCFCLPNLVVKWWVGDSPARPKGISSTGEYRRMKQLVEEYEARLPIGER
jgi:hypothetical protein